MDKNSNAENSNSSAKRWRLDNLSTALVDETGEERSDLSNVSDVEVIDDSATTVEDDYAESDEEASELSNQNDPGTSSPVQMPNQSHNRTRVSSSSSSSSGTSADIDSDDTDITSSFSSESEVLPESGDANDDIDPNLKLAYKYYDDDDNAALDLLYTTQKPNYNWNQYQEIMYREHGLSGQNRSSLIKANAIAFQNRYYGARHVIEKMKLLHSLQDQQSNANCLHFNRAGNLIVSGSDDLKILLWNWSANKIVYAFNSGHDSFVTQVKFIELSGGINIVTTDHGGQVRHAIIPPSGAKEPISQVLIKYSGYTTLLAPDINNPYEILAASENSLVKRCDLRQKTAELLATVKEKKRKVCISNIAHHPKDQEFCVCAHKFIHTYDKRKTKEPVQMMCPQHLKNKKVFISSAVYNSTGSEILASYNRENIYIFNNKCYVSGQFSHRYKGHRNGLVRDVKFFGANSEYVVSGSDCGNYFFWDKGTQSIINCIKFTENSIIYDLTIIEPHPSLPILATSGHDRDIQIWMPLKDD